MHDPVGSCGDEWRHVVDVAAAAGIGLDALLDAVLLVADAEIADDLVANPKKPARCAVLESHLDAGRGAVVTALVLEGTIRVGDTIVAEIGRAHV